MLNSVVVTNQSHLLDSSLVQLLLPTNNDGPSTSGSNMMTSTRKDTGLASSSYWCGSEYNANAENYEMTLARRPGGGGRRGVICERVIKSPPRRRRGSMCTAPCAPAARVYSAAR